MISPPGLHVDADADAIDRAVGFDDTGFEDPWNKGADTQDRPIVRAIGNGRHQFMERGGKPLRDRRQLDEQEVRRRGLAVRPRSLPSWVSRSSRKRSSTLTGRRVFTARW